MQNSNSLTEMEILEAISRSGYLLESEVTNYLVSKGYFVESNITSLDPLTGKSREIDLMANFNYSLNKLTEDKIYIASNFVLEIKNNDFPFVLLTKFEDSPNSFIWEGFKCAESSPQKYKDTWSRSFFDFIMEGNKNEMFTQYCSFSRKKNEELMAHHPEILYSSLHKIATYCEDIAFSRFKNSNDEYFRRVLYLPVLLINSDLYKLYLEEDGNNKLKKVESSRLVFNYHYKEHPCRAIIYVTTKDGLDGVLEEVANAEIKLEQEILSIKK
jgi:hypothetical protein